jgi:hypothetical protein
METRTKEGRQSFRTEILVFLIRMVVVGMVKMKVELVGFADNSDLRHEKQTKESMTINF